MGKRKKIEPITREDVELAILDGMKAAPAERLPSGVEPASEEDLIKLREAVLSGKINFSQMHMLDHRWWQCRKANFAYGGIRRHLLMHFKYRKGWDWLPDRVMDKIGPGKAADIGKEGDGGGG